MSKQDKKTNISQFKSPKFFKVAFFLCLIITLYYALVWGVIGNLTDPKIHHFENYQRLENWDSSRHGEGDFDGDGQKDLISFTGCAFLSSVQEGQVPVNKQCIATGISSMVFPGEDKKIGQKYIEMEEFDLGAYDRQRPIIHSYLGKDSADNWKIYVNSRQVGLKIVTIQNNGLLEQQSTVGVDHKIDEALYYLSSFFFLLAIPMFPIAIFLSTLFEPIKPTFSQFPLFEIVTLAGLTVLFLLLWKRTHV